MLIFVVLKTVSPRATDSRSILTAPLPGGLVQAWKRLKMFGLKFCPNGSLIPGKKSASCLGKLTASLGPKRIEILGRVVKTLGGEEAAFEIYNFLLLGSRRAGCIRLRVTECCVYRLTLQAGLTSVPHDCVSFGFVSVFGIQETQVGRGKWAAVN